MKRAIAILLAGGLAAAAAGPVAAQTYPFRHEVSVFGSWDDVDFETAQAWEEYWKEQDLAASYGEWDDLQPYFALAGFTSAVKTLGAVDAPKPFGVTYAYALKKGAVTMKGEQGVVLDVSAASSAPSAYFQTQALYIYGTGF